VARSPLTSVIIVFEITGDYGLVLPLMLGAALATFLGDRFHEDSAYTLPLTKQGIHMHTTEDIDLLDTVTVSDVMAEVDEVADPDMSVDEFDALLDRGRHHGAAVVEDGKLVGMATLTDVAKRTDPGRELTVRDVMTPKPITVSPSMQVSAALARMASLGIGRLPVVSDADPGKLVGMFRRESVVRAYHHALGMSTGRHLYRERVRLRSQQGTTFFEVGVRHASPVAGRPVAP
jgi:CIC family chloride channel protein